MHSLLTLLSANELCRSGDQLHKLGLGEVARTPLADEGGKDGVGLAIDLAQRVGERLGNCIGLSTADGAAVGVEQEAGALGVNAAQRPTDRFNGRAGPRAPYARSPTV